MNLSRAIGRSSAEEAAAVRPAADDPDHALVRRVQAGEMAAFDQLVRQYRERIFAILYNLTSNREDASDLAQEAFIKALRNIQSFSYRSSFFTWLYRIAVNGGLSHLKKTRRRRFLSFEHVDEEAAPAEVVESLAQRADGDRRALLSELQEKLNEALQKLSLKHRTVVILHDIEGLSHAEIAEVTETTEGTVRSRLHYAKKLLQAELQDYIR